MLAICMMCFQSTRLLAQDYVNQPTVDLVKSYPVSDDIVHLFVDVINHPVDEYTPWWEDPLTATSVNVLVPFVTKPIVDQIAQQIDEVSNIVDYPVSVNITEVPLLPIHEPFNVGLVIIDEIEPILTLDPQS
jgi:hypothetical protein